MKFLPDIKYHMEARNQKKFYLTYLVYVNHVSNTDLKVVQEDFDNTYKTSYDYIVRVLTHFSTIRGGGAPQMSLLTII